jgi:putative intracellular protease/amidase
MNKLFLVLLAFIAWSTSIHAQNKILFVTSNQDFYGSTTISASNHFGEIIEPYEVFIQAGYQVDFISPKGGAIPIGYLNTSNSLQKKYLYDAWFMDKLEHTMKPTEIIAENYVAIFYSGGGAAMFGVAEDVTIQKIARNIYHRNGVISTICHGTAGIAYLKDENGKSLYAGKRITGYPDKFENTEMDYYKAFPFSINQAIQKNEGDFVYSEKAGDGFHLVDGRFVTGQDPSSTTQVAGEVVKMLKHHFQNPNGIVKTDSEQVTETLLHYIEGTANGQPERLRKAFHPNFNLYTVATDSLWIRSGEQYIANVQVGEKTNRIGKIISIDIEKDAAMAKAEILIPNVRLFTDYFLLLKYGGAWKIVHKSYSWRDLTPMEGK